MMRNLFILGCVAAAFVLPNVVGRCQADGCAPLSAETRGKIATYAAERYELAPDVRIEDGGVVASSCFRHLTVQSTTPRRSIELFLSPDQRFLSESLFDSWLDPALERRRGRAGRAGGPPGWAFAVRRIGRGRGHTCRVLGFPVSVL